MSTKERRRSSTNILSQMPALDLSKPDDANIVCILRWQISESTKLIESHSIHFQPNVNKNVPELLSPMDGSEITSFNIATTGATANAGQSATLKTLDENYYANTPKNQSPANVYRSDDCNELLAKELAGLDVDEASTDDRYNLVSQSSIEIEIGQEKEDAAGDGETVQKEDDEAQGEVGFHCLFFQGTLN